MSDTLQIARPPKTFPVIIHFGGTDEKIVLHAGGGYEANVTELRKIVAQMEGFGDLSNAILWLLLSEMERHPERRIV